MEFGPLDFPRINLLAGWGGLTLGFVTGFLLGLRFHEPEWRGGYGSLERRMIRLAHISLFGLAIINLLFFFTSFGLSAKPPGWQLQTASWSFIVGAVTMPLCCLAMARTVLARPSFLIPVASLTLGGVLTCWALVAR